MEGGAGGGGGFWEGMQEEKIKRKKEGTCMFP